MPSIQRGPVKGSESSKASGFTLIELLIVIGIIGFLAAAILVAVDPVKRIQDSRDAQRWSEVNGLLNAVLTKQVDDRALYDGAPSHGIVDQGSGSNVQVIVTSDTGVDCTAAATRPGCDQAMDTGTADSCIADLSDTSTGTGTIASGSATTPFTLTGTSTAFTTEVKAGDVITGLTSSATCTVATVTSATAVTCSADSSGFSSGESFSINRSGDSIVPSYIASIPQDPAGGTPCATGSTCTTVGDLAIGSTNSGYFIARTTGNRIEIGACKPEQASSISVKR